MIEGRAMPQGKQIIERDARQVNRDSRFCSRVRVRRACAGGVCLVLLGWLACATGCDRSESRAERMRAEATRLVERSEMDAASELYREVVDRYPGTRAARRAHAELLLYEGLSDAVRDYPLRQTRAILVRTARALQSVRDRRGRWPATLDAIVPRWASEPPIDPWGRILIYEPERGGRGYRLTCHGADGRPGGAGAAGDWQVRNGRFVQTP